MLRLSDLPDEWGADLNVTTNGEGAITHVVRELDRVYDDERQQVRRTLTVTDTAVTHEEVATVSFTDGAEADRATMRALELMKGDVACTACGVSMESGAPIVSFTAGLLRVFLCGSCLREAVAVLPDEPGS